MIGVNFHIFSFLYGYPIDPVPFVENYLFSVFCNASFVFTYSYVLYVFELSNLLNLFILASGSHCLYYCWFIIFLTSDQVLTVCSLLTVSQLFLAFFITIWILNSADQIIHTHTHTPQMEFLLGLLWIYRSIWELTLLQYWVF